MPSQTHESDCKSEAMQRRLAQLHQAMGHGNVPGNSTGVEQPAPPPPAVDRPRRDPLTRATAPARTKLWWSLGLMAVPCTWLLSQVTGAAPSREAVAPPVQIPPPTGTVPPSAQTSMAAPSGSDDAAVRNMVEQWRLDWSRRDVSAYLGHYSARFETGDGRTRTQWEAQRRRNLLNRSAIRVEVNDLRLERQDTHHVVVHFKQTYLSGPYQEVAQPKTLSLVLEDGRWRIDGEWQDNGDTQANAKSR